MSPIELQATNIVTTMLHGVDALDWEAVRASLAHQVTVDYTSLWGGDPEKVTADELVNQWRRLLSGFDATNHVTGPIVITRADEGSAACAATVRGYHHLVGDNMSGTWMVAGRYDIGLGRGADGWAIDAITLAVAYEDGSRTLVDVAQRRGETGTGGRYRRSG